MTFHGHVVIITVQAHVVTAWQLSSLPILFEMKRLNPVVLVVQESNTQLNIPAVTEGLSSGNSVQRGMQK